MIRCLWHLVHLVVVELVIILVDLCLSPIVLWRGRHLLFIFLGNLFFTLLSSFVSIGAPVS